MIINHIAVQTADLAKSVAWYERVFDAYKIWELDKFSDTTRRRLPGIRKLVELRAQSLVFHIFDRAGVAAVPGAEVRACYQHICIETDSIARMEAFRARLLTPDGSIAPLVSPPTEIEWDGVKSASFYFLDVNGLEYEMTWFAETLPPSGTPVQPAFEPGGV